MREQDQMGIRRHPQQHRLSRRRFLRVCGLGMAGALGAGSCSQLKTPMPDAQRSATPAPTGTLTSVPSSRPSASATVTISHTPTPTPLPIVTATPTPAMDKVFDENTLVKAIVAYDSQTTTYPPAVPFDPSRTYPEYPFADDQPGPVNGAYDLVRQALSALSPAGLGNYDWNPLAGIIMPGDTVLVKPNLVDDALWERGKITHPAVIRAVIDYAFMACGPAGRIIVGDGPWAVGVFDRLASRTGIQHMVEHLAHTHRVPVTLEDLNRSPVESTLLVEAGALSAFHGIQRNWYDAHGADVQRAGGPGIGRYRIAPTILRADVVISVPKVKVHCSGGLTLNMKNMLGIVPAWDSHPDGSLKDCPHTSDVDLAQGKRGEFLDNDTIWRSMADLNRILLYADRKGILQPARQRRYLAIVDGIVAGEASQYEPRPRPLSSIIIGFGPVTADAVAARVAGFDPRLLRSIVQPASKGNYGLGPAHSSEILVVLRGAGSVQEFCTAERIIVPESDIYPWVGHVEANDFAPPHLSWRYEGERQRLLVQAEDPAGVAYVRLACRRQGQPRTIALDRQGDAKRGEWSSPLPAIEQLDSLWLTAADELFNATSVPLKL